MMREPPGVPTLLRKIGIDSLGQFVLPCVFPHYADYFYKPQSLSKDKKEMGYDGFDGIHPEPYRKIKMRIFSAVDPEFAPVFLGKFRIIGERKKNLGLAGAVGYECKIEELPEVSRALLNCLEELDNGFHFLVYFKNDLKELRKVNPLHLSTKSTYKLIYFWKVDEINEKAFERKFAVVNHHTLHTYKEYSSNPRKCLEEIIKSSKEIASTQLINLHGLRKENRSREPRITTLSELEKAVSKIGFDSIYYAEVRKKVGRNSYRYDVEIKGIESSEINSIETGCHKWLILLDHS